MRGDQSQSILTAQRARKGDKMSMTYQGSLIKELKDKLDNIRDDFKTWNAFPCNAPGNMMCADKERAKILAEIKKLEKAVKKEEAKGQKRGA